MKRCAFCGETLQNDFNACPHCGAGANSPVPAVLQRVNRFGAWGLVCAVCAVLPAFFLLTAVIGSYVLAVFPNAELLIFFNLLLSGAAVVSGMSFSFGFSAAGIALSAVGLVRRGRYRANGLAIAGLALAIAALAAMALLLLV